MGDSTFLNPNLQTFTSQPTFEQVSTKLVDRKSDLLNQASQLDAVGIWSTIITWIKKPIVASVGCGILMFIMWYLFDPSLTKEKNENGDYTKQNPWIVLTISVGTFLVVYFIPKFLKK
jgi:hypothetical protein